MDQIIMFGLWAITFLFGMAAGYLLRDFQFKNPDPDGKTPDPITLKETKGPDEKDADDEKDGDD